MDYLKWIGRKISKNNVKFTIAIAFIAVHLGGYLIAINGGNRILALGLVLGSYLLGTAFAVGHTYYIADKKKTERVQ